MDVAAEIMGKGQASLLYRRLVQTGRAVQAYVQHSCRELACEMYFIVIQNPGSGETLAEMSAATGSDIDRAVASAKAAFKSGVWSRLAPRKRKKILFRFADLVDEHAEELAVLDIFCFGPPAKEPYKRWKKEMSQIVSWEKFDPAQFLTDDELDTWITEQRHKVMYKDAKNID